MIQDLLEVYKKNMQMVIADVTAYSNEEDIWVIKEGINNSAGNLVLHLIGNLQFFIGNVLGNNGYIRDRDAEFSNKNIQQSVLISELNTTATMITNTFSAMKDEQLYATYPIDKFGEGKTTGFVLLHLLAHLTYHLGQINYHRRLLNK